MCQWNRFRRRRCLSIRRVRPRRAEPTYRSGPDGELGALLPIQLLTTCVLCHGTEADLAEGVQEALAVHYPDDEATGFAPGDLRGWFWMEVPRPSDGGPGS